MKINDTVKYFGITIDNRLNFEEHIQVKLFTFDKNVGICRNETLFHQS